MRESASTAEAISGKIENTRIMITAGMMNSPRDWRSSHSAQLARAGRGAAARPGLAAAPADAPVDHAVADAHRSGSPAPLSW